jgi:hydroxycarboxylate dehydrogenase B
MILAPAPLERLVTAIFAAAGCDPPEAARIAGHLVDANLAGHDSHGVLRVSAYVDWLRKGHVLANRRLSVVQRTSVLAIVDGERGFGQSIGVEATALGVEMALAAGVAVVALRNSGHLGRIGAWPLQAARAGIASVHFVSTSGGGILVAPFGGRSRRLSADPIAAGIPRSDGEPVILDMSCCTIAEGKLKVALNKGAAVPEGCIIDSAGRPTTDPRVFYADPPGSILPIAGHKGYGLGVIVELLAGALTGGGASDPAHAGRVNNNMLSIYLRPDAFGDRAAFDAEVTRFIDWVKTAERVDPDREILLPGEIEERTRASRIAAGLEIDAATWDALAATARSLGIDAAAAVAGAG